MTKDENQNTTRSTLKLKLNVNPAAETKTLALKSENKKVSSSAVQVTIKGRKKEVKNNESDLNKKELEARFKAISSSDSKLEDNINSHEILTKFTKNKKQKSEVVDQKEEVVAVVETIEEKPEPTHETTALNNKKPTDFKLDNFDVRNKIKQSVEITNRQKEEREKLLEERRKQEEVLEKEKSEREKKSKHKKPGNNFTSNFDGEDSFGKKSKNNFKNEKTNSRKLTYIIDSDGDDSEGFARKRKKHKIKQQEVEQTQKEYKKLIREVALPELITVADLADRMTEKAGDLVKKLFTMGMVATSNQVIDADTAELLVVEFGHIAKRVSHSDVENILDEDDPAIEKLSRAPIVTIMGHVDHGKTSLLDAIRTTDVAGGEHGGITQHIGASRIKTNCGKYITFLDTPGHEAFTEMRSRGANITDVVVLVVAADDGVKAQTIEAINHAKAAGVPIIVAVNKIDKPDANPDRVKNELLSYDIVAEDLGGEVMFIPVSAKNKINLDKLEEAILLQTEILELKAPYSGKSSGVVIESRIDPAKGVVATLLVQKGTLDISDLIVVGTSYGKIRKMTDDHGKNIKVATPSMPVEVLGLDNAPNAGDKFVEVSEERQAREIISYRARKGKEEKSLKNSVKNLSDIFKESGKGTLKYLNVIIKGDVHGSVEALQGSISKLNNDEVAIKVVHSATGGITETDIGLAAVSNAIIIGFNVRANIGAKDMAKLKNIDIRYYSIIYNVVDDIKLLLSGMLEPIKNEEYLGQAEIRQVFKISGTGKIGGAFVTDGMVKRSAKVRLLRENVVIYDGVLKTLKRFKDDVKEVKSGFECGIAFENYEDIKEKDVIECYEIVEQKRSL
ncbi:MAG: translation initiation factor IF-2 [Rickettsiales bacterium]|nr:translation initiation factor IF-2 [Rickettsiales bacterium]